MKNLLKRVIGGVKRMAKAQEELLGKKWDIFTKFMSDDNKPLRKNAGIIIVSFGFGLIATAL